MGQDFTRDRKQNRRTSSRSLTLVIVMPNIQIRQPIDARRFAFKLSVTSFAMGLMLAHGWFFQKLSSQDQLHLGIASVPLQMVCVIDSNPDPSANVQDHQEEEREPDIRQIMRFAMTQGLCQKVIKQQASQEEKQRLVTLFATLAKLDPPVGSSDNWLRRTKGLMDSARSVSEGGVNYDALAKAANCAECHKEHRPK